MKPPIKSRPTAEPPLIMIGEAMAMCNKGSRGGFMWGYSRLGQV